MTIPWKRNNSEAGSRAGSASFFEREQRGRVKEGQQASLPEELEVREWFDLLPEQKPSHRVMQSLALAAQDMAAEQKQIASRKESLSDKIRSWVSFERFGFNPAFGWGLAASLIIGVAGHFATFTETATVVASSESEMTQALAWDYELPDTETLMNVVEIGTGTCSSLEAPVNGSLLVNDSFDMDVLNLQNSLASLADDIDEF